MFNLVIAIPRESNTPNCFILVSNRVLIILVTNRVLNTNRVLIIPSDKTLEKPEKFRMVNTNCNTLRYNTYPMVWEIKYLLNHDFSRATKLLRILDDCIPLTEIGIIELKIKYMETLIRN